MMLMAPLASIISIVGVPFLFCQASRLPVPIGPDSHGGYHESSRVYGGFAKILMDGVIGCRYGGFSKEK